MARLRNGIFGGIEGKLGNLVGYEFNDKSYLRAIPDDFKYNNTASQQAHKNQFMAVVKFAQLLNGSIIKPAWTGLSKGMTAFNLFTSTNYPAFNTEGVIEDYSKIVITKGELALPEELKMEREANRLSISWLFDRNSSLAFPDDIVYLLVYEKGNSLDYIDFLDIAHRDDCSSYYDLSNLNEGSCLGFYLFFSNYSYTQFSDSVHFEIRI